MPCTCCAYGCKNRQVKNSPISFHSFPHHKPNELDKWIAAVGLKHFFPTQASRLCSEHFTKADFAVRPDADRRLLKEGAVPSVFFKLPPYSQQHVKQKENPLDFDEDLVDLIEIERLTSETFASEHSEIESLVQNEAAIRSLANDHSYSGTTERLSAKDKTDRQRKIAQTLRAKNKNLSRKVKRLKMKVSKLEEEIVSLKEEKKRDCSCSLREQIILCKHNGITIGRGCGHKETSPQA